MVLKTVPKIVSVDDKEKTRQKKLEYLLWDEGFTVSQCLEYAKAIDKMLATWNKERE